MKPYSKSALTAVLVMLLSAAASALPSDRNQPISYQADRAQRDHQSGTTILEGSVVMERGSIRIEADRVVIRDRGDKVNLIVATGTPARYRQIPEKGAEPVIASAKRLEYRLAEQSLHLIDQASLVQGGSSLTGNRIDYDVTQAVVQAGSDELDRTERVRMVIPAEALQSARDADDTPGRETSTTRKPDAGDNADEAPATPTKPEPVDRERDSDGQDGAR